MGVSQSWIAAKGVSPNDVNGALEIHPTEKRMDLPESKISAVELPNGFYLVLFDHRELQPSRLRTLSESFPLLYGFAEEHVMYSSVAAWENGTELWHIAHDAQKDIQHLEVRGVPPAGFTAIRDRLLAQQAGEQESEVDYVFDIPVDLARELTGYKYDEEPEGLGPGAFAVMEPTRQKLWSRWNPFR